MENVSERSYLVENVSERSYLVENVSERSNSPRPTAVSPSATHRTANIIVMKKIFPLLLSLLPLVAALADKQVSGVVVDDKGVPVIGASVQASGTTIGTITDIDGLFSLTIPDDAATITISYIGMQTIELPATLNMKVILRENTEVIQEVVVTGYGNVPKGSFAGSTQAVKADAIEKKMPSDITKALTGEVAGMQVITTTGQPGQEAEIRIRGIGSLIGNTAALCIVDGIPYDRGMADINPSDIASITVLKDATATSLYGSRGANGVILITTKKGAMGVGSQIDVDVRYGANMRLLPVYDVITSPEEYVELAWMGIYNTNTTSDPALRISSTNNALFSSKGIPSTYNLWDAPSNALIDPWGHFDPTVSRKADYQNLTSWQDAVFRVGQKAEAEVKISGGAENITYYTSFAYLKDEGYYIGSDYDRFSVRSNIEYHPRSWLKGSFNVAYSYTDQNSAGQGQNYNNGFSFINGIPPIYPVYLYNSDGTIRTDPTTGRYAYDYGMAEGSGRSFGTGNNPAGSLQYDRDNRQRNQVSATTMLEFTLYDGLTFTLNAGVQYLSDAHSQFSNAYFGESEGIGRTSKQQINYLNFTSNQLLEYNKTIADDHSLRVLAGHETHYTRDAYLHGTKNHVAAMQGLATLEWGNAVQMVAMNSYTGYTTLESYLAIASYTYSERYGITGNYRADGSSKFAKGHRWGHFGSVGAFWIFTNEPFLANVKWLKNGKLRASWGVQGNQDAIPANAFYDQYTLQNLDGEVAYSWGYKGNEDLTWEHSSQFDLGLEADMSKYVSLSFDYFNKITDHMLYPRYSEPSKGYTYIYGNSGKMQNQGVELQLNIHAVNTDKVKLNIRWNGSHYANKILELPKFSDVEQDTYLMGNLAVGHSSEEWLLRTYCGVEEETGLATYLGYYDANLGDFGFTPARNLQDQGLKGDNYISNVYDYQMLYPDADIRTYTMKGAWPAAIAGTAFIGKTPSPALAGGFGFDLEVYGVSLSVSCSYGLGGYGYDYIYRALMQSVQAGKYNWHTDMRGAWNDLMTPDEKAAVAALGDKGVPRLSNGAYSDRNAAAYSTRFLTSNTFLSLNNIRLGYDLPASALEKMHLRSLGFYISADNLALASARKGYNPLGSFDGSSNPYQYTPLSTVVGGISLQF